MAEEYKLPRGTQDFLPLTSEKLSCIEYVLKNVANLYGYREIRTPIFEHTNLFLRSVGESSDIVNKEMYTFLDKGGRSITLRPEGTAGVMRAFVENKMYASPDMPIKLFYDGPVFRYERPGAGRYRQITQFGFECLGVHSPLIDAELILMNVTMLYMLGIKNFVIKVNSIGDTLSRENYKKELRDYFKDHIAELCDDCKRRYEQNPLRILDCKIDGDNELVKNAPIITDYLTEESKAYFNKLLSYLDKFGVPYEIDNRLVRGLDYYCDTVFEIKCQTPEGKDYGAIGAGGRYDGLIEQVGGPHTPGIGMAFGVERLLLLLDSYKLFDENMNAYDVLITPIGGECLDYAFEITSFLRSNGFKCECEMQGKSMKSFFKSVERQKVPFAIIVGEDEMKNEVCNIKNTQTKEQITLDLNDLCGYLNNELNKNQCSCGGKCSNKEKE